jgi:twinfilin
VHQHEEEQFSPVIFIYSCPGNSKVKERMLYSTVKAAAIESASSLGLTVDKKIEITDPEDLSESDLLQELHPEKREIVTKTAFNRPSKPGRGRPRMTRN